MSESLDHDAKVVKELKVTETAKRNMKMIAGWGVFIGIYGFMITIMMLLYAFRMYHNASELTKVSSGFAESLYTQMASYYNIVGTVMLVIGLLMIVPGIFLIRYAYSIKNAVNDSDMYDFEEATKYLRNVFVFGGCYAILMILIFTCGFLGVFTPEIGPTM